MGNKKPQTTWGRSRFGGNQASLLGVSILGGTLLAQPLGWGILALQEKQISWWLVPLVSIPLVPIFTTILWVVLVDRSSIKGAPRNPQTSVENHWYSKAAETTFHVMIASMGLAGATFAIFDWTLPSYLLLTATTALSMLVFLISYQIYKHRGI